MTRPNHPSDFQGEPPVSPASASRHHNSPPAHFDPLLSALEYISRSFGLPFSRSGAIIGLPLKNGRLSVELVDRAATRMGLSSKLVKRRPSRVSPMVIPFIVLLENGDAAVVVDRHADSKSLSVIFPASSDVAHEVPYQWLDERSSGYVIYVTAEVTDTRAQERPDRQKKSGHWFWSPVLQYWPSWLQIVIAALLVNILGLAMPLFVMNVYDRVIPNLAIPTLWALAAGVGIALGFDFLLKLVRAVVLDRTGRRVDMNIAAGLFDQALAIAMKDRRSTAGATASQIREFETVRDFFTSSSIIALTDLAFIGLFILVIWLIVGPIAFVPLAAVPVVILVAIFIQIPLARSVEKTQNQSARRQSILVESLIGIESVKAAGAEGLMQRKWEDAITATARANSSTKFWSALAMHFTGTVQQGVGIVIIIWGVFLVAGGQITIGGLIAANILSGRVLAPLGNIAMTITRAQQAFVAMRNLGAFMALPSERRETVSIGNRVKNGLIEFHDITFSYDGSPRPALENVSFVVRPGERVGIIGRVGSGKTSIGKLLAGFYQADTGSILVSGTDTRAYEVAELRDAVTLVPQEPELFTGTLRENIIMGNQTASEEEINTASKVAGVDRFASQHALGLAMPVGERGRGLSGGQRQAVALARMLLKKNTHILYLDEPSSSMDTGSENMLVNMINNWLGREKTLIVCTHRGAFLGLVDRLIVLDNGKIQADGPKQEVLQFLQERAKENQRRQQNPQSSGNAAR